MGMDARDGNGVDDRWSRRSCERGVNDVQSVDDDQPGDIEFLEGAERRRDDRSSAGKRLENREGDLDTSARIGDGKDVYVCGAIDGWEILDPLTMNGYTRLVEAPPLLRVLLRIGARDEQDVRSSARKLRKRAEVARRTDVADVQHSRAFSLRPQDA
jgi:hypothetical protein